MLVDFARQPMYSLKKGPDAKDGTNTQANASDKSKIKGLLWLCFCHWFTSQVRLIWNIFLLILVLCLFSRAESRVFFLNAFLFLILSFCLLSDHAEVLCLQLDRFDMGNLKCSACVF